MDHKDILNELLQQFTPINFDLLAFPQKEAMLNEIENLRNSVVTEGPDGKIITTSDKTESEIKDIRDKANKIEDDISKLKLNEKHYLILSIENVVKVAKEHNWNLCKNLDFIYLYNGCYWSEIDKEAFQKFLGEASEKMGVTKFSARFYEFRKKLFEQFLTSSYLPTPIPNKEKVCINLSNGTFEISNKETILRPFKSFDFLTYQLPFEYNKDSIAPMFNAYLDKVLPDIGKQKILAEFLGYVFIKNGGNSIKIEKALILFGSGANGKSVFFEIVNALLGVNNVSSFSLQSLTEEKGFYRAKINNKLVNYASEINGKLEASIFKQLVSGEPVEACLKYGQPFSMIDYAKLIFNCNELPKDVEQTHAFFRRFLIIHFDITIDEKDQDKQLHTKIIENELSGVFNWVLEGLNRLLAQTTFTQCKAVDEALQSYITDSDSVKQFIIENGYEKSTNDTILLKELFAPYKEFCNEDGFKPVQKNNFRKQLTSIGINIEKKNIGNVAYLTKIMF
ncbi:MAG: DNA primase [Bacteroidetes bacterium]|nr:DNA primase [Bacteroidota bacterium]